MAILGRGRKRDVTPEFAEVEAAEAAGDIPALKRLLEGQRLDVRKAAISALGLGLF
jgi:HEAT repeat protein